MVLSVEHLTKYYKDFCALDNVSFDMKQGEIVGLLGPNGAGKTTIIHVLLGLLTPTSGCARVLGFNPVKERQLMAPHINFSSAYTSLPSNLKVIENMKVYAGLYGVKKAANVIDELLNLFELTCMKNRLTGALSSGEKTRLNLCKSLLNDPKILLLDEPTASLDPVMSRNVMDIIKKLQADRKMTVLYTSHDMDEVEELCQRIIFVNQGKIMAFGSATEVKNKFSLQTLDEVFIHITKGLGEQK